VDKVTKDLSEVELIKIKLLSKAWDTTSSRKFVQDEAEKVHTLRDDMLAKWVLLKQDSHEDMNDKAMTDKTKEADGYAQQVTAGMKSLVNNVLKEFRS